MVGVSLLANAVCHPRRMSLGRRFATVVTSDCSYRRFALDTDFGGGYEMVGVSVLAKADCQSA